MRSSFARAVCVATVLSAAGPGLALAAGPGLRDDGYHYGLFRNGAHDFNYVEWWYFNLVDHSSGLDLAFTYSILDPENLTGIGSTGLLAWAFTDAGNLQASEFLPADRFHGSPESASLLVGHLGAVEVLDETWKPVVFEQAARHSGTLWVRDEGGRWRLGRTLAGPGFKEYAARTLVTVSPESR
jgi:hypothetical protein